MTTKYDPKADYEVVRGPVSIKDPKTNNRTLLGIGEKTKLTHLEPHEIAFLVEEKRTYRVATATAGGKGARTETKGGEG